MGDVIKELVHQLYPWHIHAIGGIIAVALGIFFWFTFWGVHKYTNAFAQILGRDERIQKLQETIEHSKENMENRTLVANQVTKALFNVKSFLDTLNFIRMEENPDTKTIESFRLIQRILDQLSNDVKVKGGAQHRCGMWIASDDKKELKLHFISFGFPRHYRGNRTLEVHDSAAGKTFVKKQKQNIPDVRVDKDWRPSPNTDVVRYKSLICIPLGEFGVLTIDGEEPMSEECELIGEVYGALIEAAVVEHDRGYSQIEFEKLMDLFDKDEEVG